VRIDPSSDIIERELDTHSTVVEERMKGDVLAFFGPILYGVEDHIRIAVEETKKKRRRLVVVLETFGGYIEVVQRIADTLRHHYGQIDFVIPDYAMSAGTVLVMSGDAIHMDYFSVLGPIDPQVGRPDGKMIPALGYLEKYNELIAKSQSGTLTTAEMSFLISKFDPAELYQYERAKELSNSLLKEWLVRYKFKNWKVTRTHRRKVTKKMKIARAAEIADKLNDTKKWNSHGRGISMQVLRRDLNLEIEDLGQDEELSACIRGYYKLLRDYMAKRGHSWVVHTREQYRPIGG
jgi:Serine dehydrogenase proteinase